MMVATGDRIGLVQGHTWLACDLAARALDYFDLASYLGEELATVGVSALWRAARLLKPAHRNIAAVLAESVEHEMIEWVQTDRLCFVPPRTGRDRAAKGKPAAELPWINLQIDLRPSIGRRLNARAFDREWDQFAALFGLRTLPDIYTFCRDQLDRDICRLRYDGGSGPRCLAEVAGVLGRPYRQVEQRLDELEHRVYLALERRKPTRRRVPGKSRKSQRILADAG
jgi:hypothetical protein